MNEANETHVYVGRCRGCGQILGARLEELDRLEAVGKFVAELIACGLVIDRVPADPPVGFGRCACGKGPAGARADG